MSISKSQVSLSALRTDLSMSANGGTQDRRIWNKDGQRMSGDISLVDYKGNLLGGQLQITGSANQAPTNRGYGYTGFWPANGGAPFIDGGDIITSSQMRGFDGTDRSSEYRISGLCQHSGTYRLTGSVDFARSNSYAVQFWQVAVVESSTGYMSGSIQNTVLVFSDRRGVNNLFYNISLSTSRPYVTLILYSITKQGGDPALGSFYSRWNNIKMVAL